MRKWILISVACLAIFFFWKQGFQIVNAPLKTSESEVVLPLSVPELVKLDTILRVAEKQSETLVEKIIQDVPFTSQAPTGNWRDLIFQNACEEATLLMADKWREGKIFGTPKETEAEIESLTKAEEKYFLKGSYDLSATDTLLFAQKYFPEMRISLVKNVTTNDIRNAVLEGNIVIVPVNGRKLQNPNFTAPGPLYHTLLIRGFDPVTDEYITNDPGTRKGNGYRYPADILFDAMQDYETSYHGKLFPDEKVMLVVSI